MNNELMNLSNEILYEAGKISTLADIVMEREIEEKIYVPLLYIHDTAMKIKKVNNQMERILLEDATV